MMENHCQYFYKNYNWFPLLAFRKCSRSLTIYGTIPLILTLFLVIVPFSSSENFRGGTCERDCDHHRKRKLGDDSQDGFNEPFIFRCTEFRGTEIETCRNTCKKCPPRVCHPRYDKDTYNCPARKIVWPEKLGDSDDQDDSEEPNDPNPNYSREESNDDNGQNSNNSYVIAFGVVGFLVVVISIICCVFCNKRGGPNPATQGQVSPFMTGESNPLQQGMITQQNVPTMPPGSLEPNGYGGMAQTSQQQSPGNYSQWSYPAAGYAKQ